MTGPREALDRHPRSGSGRIAALARAFVVTALVQSPLEVSLSGAGGDWEYVPLLLLPLAGFLTGFLLFQATWMEGRPGTTLDLLIEGFLATLVVLHLLGLSNSSLEVALTTSAAFVLSTSAREVTRPSPTRGDAPRAGGGVPLPEVWDPRPSQSVAFPTTAVLGSFFAVTWPGGDAPWSWALVFAFLASSVLRASKRIAHHTARGLADRNAGGGLPGERKTWRNVASAAHGVLLFAFLALAHYLSHEGGTLTGFFLQNNLYDFLPDYAIAITLAYACVGGVLLGTAVGRAAMSKFLGRGELGSAIAATLLTGVLHAAALWVLYLVSAFDGLLCFATAGVGLVATSLVVSWLEVTRPGIPARP
ncbi:MAG: hypothetical protein ACTSU5_20720 [Promethearchaeota archaeon]